MADNGRAEWQRARYVVVLVAAAGLVGAVTAAVVSRYVESSEDDVFESVATIQIDAATEAGQALRDYDPPDTDGIVALIESSTVRADVAAAAPEVTSLDASASDDQNSRLVRITARSGVPVATQTGVDAAITSVEGLLAARETEFLQERQVLLARRVDDLTADYAELQARAEADGQITGAENQLLNQAAQQLRQAEDELAQYELAIELADGSLTVVAPAFVPGARVAPNPGRDGIVAGVLAAVVVVALGLIAPELRRTRVRSVDLRDALPEARWVGEVPELGRADRAVVESMAGLTRKLPEVLFARLRTVLAPPGQTEAGVVIVVASSTSGEGKSLTSSGLAQALVSRGETVLVDADTLRSTVGRRIDRSWPASEMATGGFVSPSGVHVVDLIGGDTSPEAVEARLDELSERFDHVVVDVPPVRIGPLSGRLLATADRPVMVVRLGETDPSDLERTVALLRGQGVDPASLSLVVTHAGGDAYGDYLKG